MKKLLTLFLVVSHYLLWSQACVEDFEYEITQLGPGPANYCNFSTLITWLPYDADSMRMNMIGYLDPSSVVSPTFPGPSFLCPVYGGIFEAPFLMPCDYTVVITMTAYKDGVVCAFDSNTPIISLPVELTSFEVKKTARKEILLEWTTASERVNAGFEIERSPNGRDWSILGFSEGNGTSNDINHYEFRDKTPIPGNNYYRLKQIDFNGHFDYSPIKNIFLDHKFNNRILVYPNPNDGQFRLDIHNPEKEKARVQIFSSIGNIVFEYNFTDHIPLHWSKDFSFPQFGMYYVHTQIGDNTYTDKIVIIDRK